MIHSNLWYTPDKNIWKKALHAADLILYLVSKRNKLIKIYIMKIHGAYNIFLIIVSQLII
jgi:hypothetical protein